MKEVSEWVLLEAERRNMSNLEIAVAMGISPRTLYNRLKTGELGVRGVSGFCNHIGYRLVPIPLELLGVVTR